MESVYVENNLPVITQQIHDLRFPAPAIRHPAFDFPLKNKYNRFIKRSFDITVSSIFIITVLSWLIPLFALLIKLDSRGPVFFRQKRNRNGGKLFTCIKFRTMIMNEEADLLAAEINDKRVTRFGKFLRSHYLDELPQFINVLFGDMSIVGPRPHMISDNLKYEGLIKKYAYRHTIKPGITGLAQVRGYAGHISDLKTMEARVTLDIFYMQHWSAKFDMAILYRTFFKSLGL